MRRIITAIIGMAALSAADAPAAFAGDATPSAPVAASPCVHCYFPERWTANWTGFYIGGDLGGAWTSNTATWNPLPSPLAFGVFPITASNSGSGFIGGFHAGYNYQFAPTWIVGLEGDWSWTRAHDSFTQPMAQDPPPVILPGSFTTMSTTLDWLSSLSGRFGYLV